ncbi:MAG: class I tRNA ligase family protein, partial [Candidatus Ratteibacteria bacterium]|nr:class I tRNA ligase family protein [Candidatus Ratteibacteria bacterium]
GFVVDSEGKKMSKSLGNVTNPQAIVASHGADILRLWAVSSDWTSDIRIGEEILKRCIEAYRKIRNTARFILGNLYDFKYSKNALPQSKWLKLDKWAHNRCLLLLKNVKEAYEDFQFIKAYQLLYQFSNVDMSSAYLDILKDRLYILPADSIERRSAQTVMYFILKTLTQLIAPFMSFTAEEIWQNGGFEEKSVFLTNLPKEQKIDEALEQKWQKIFALREIVQKSLEEARQNGMIGGSLEAEVVLYAQDSYLKSLGVSKEDLATIFIVSSVEIAPSKGKELTAEIKKAPGEKCARCWKWDKNTDTTSQLCPRCDTILKIKRDYTD